LELITAEKRHASNQALVILIPDVCLLAKASTFTLNPLAVSWREPDVKESIHISYPLLLKMGRDDEQYSVGAITSGKFFENKSGLNSFAKSHVIGDECSLPEFLHHPVDAS